VATEAWLLEGASIGEGDEIANSLADRILTIQGAVGGGEGHVPLFTGSIYYVDAAQADDTGDGKSPETAKKTVNAALGIVSAGDAITVKTGTYDEDGMDLDLVGLELWCENGAVFQNTTPGTVLTVSGADCYVRGLRTAQAGQIGVHITGTRCVFDWCRATGGPSVGFDIDGTSVTLRDCWAGQPTTTGFDVGVNGAKLIRCHATGTGAASRGFYVSGGLRGHFLNCTSIDNATAGFETAVGADIHLFLDCASGGGDGARVDSGMNNFWPGFADTMRREHHEHLYPVSDGEGTAGGPVTVSNSTTDDAAGNRDDQDYWGDPVCVIPPGALTNPWMSLGLYISAVTASDDQQWQAFFPQPLYSSAQNGGNDWDKDETALTVADGTVFEADDLVWITGDDVPDGEILKVVSSIANVVTIVSETRMGGGVGVRYDYDIAPDNNMMYVVFRDSNKILHGFSGAYSAGSAKDFTRFIWHEAKWVDASGGMIMRMLNATDAQASSFGARAIYED